MDKNTGIGLGAVAFCLAFVFLTQGPDPKRTALETETMRIHDETMKTMADMNRVARALKKETATLDSLAPRREAIRQALFQMKKAEEDMYTWMRQYSPPGQLPPEEALRYLEDQKRKIEQNQRDINAALAAGQTLLPQTH